MRFSWSEIKLIAAVPMFRFLLGNNTRGIMSFIRLSHQFSPAFCLLFSLLSLKPIFYMGRSCVYEENVLNLFTFFNVIQI